MKVRLIEALDSKGNELSPEQEVFFKRSKVRNDFGELLVVYRGTVAQNERNYFSGNAKWFTSNKDYADKYDVGENKTTYECYLNCTNVFDCGNTDGRLFNLNPTKLSLTNDFLAVLHRLNLTEQLFVKKFEQELKDKSSYTWHIYTVVRTDKFIDLVRRSGYDCIHTIEEGNNDCYGVLYDRCIKLTSNLNPTNSDKINESKENKQNLTEAQSPAGYAPKKSGKAYKVFRVKNGRLYPPMVANAGGKDTPIGVWLDAEEGEFAGLSKTGRQQVKSTGSGTLAYRPGWHLGDVPRAPQFDRKNKETGEMEFPKDFVWAECDYAMDIDYQPEADEQGYMRTSVDSEGNVITTRSDKYQHSLAGLKKLPKNGYYKYKTNPRPDTVPWVITGQMRVNKLLSDDEVNSILKSKGIAPIHRQGGDKTLKELGLNESLNESLRKLHNTRTHTTRDSYATYNVNDVIDLLKNTDHDWRLMYDDHEKLWLLGEANDVIHFDMLESAWDQGYFDDNMDWIYEYVGADTDSYRDIAEDGFYLNEGEPNEEWVDPWLYSLLYVVDNDDSFYQQDGFVYNAMTTLGGRLYARDNYSLEETPLKQIII